MRTEGGFIIVDLDAKSSNPAKFRQHANQEQATEEAKRLADENPGHRFCVYNPICIAQRATPVTVTYIEKELPF